MKKLDGLRFLQKNFSSLTVDCLFVDKLENLDDAMLYSEDDSTEQLWRVRTGRKRGPELNLPQGTFKDIKELKEFIRKQSEKDSTMEFVVHRVSPRYFTAPFVGTLTVCNDYTTPRIRIELQKATKQLVSLIDKGKRPRDWEVSLILDYKYLARFPRILRKDAVNLENIKDAIAVIHEVGERIFELYDEKNQDIETYTRFNIYSLGQVILDDHRSADSFIAKYKCNNLPPIEQTNPKKEKIEEMEFEK